LLFERTGYDGAMAGNPFHAASGANPFNRSGKPVQLLEVPKAEESFRPLTRFSPFLNTHPRVIDVEAMVPTNQPPRKSVTVHTVYKTQDEEIPPN
jgi:hypothetical protein